MREGISGILRPNGVFIPCAYGKHYTIAGDIPCEEEFDCIVFSSKPQPNDGRSSAITWNKKEGITQVQFDWIMAHINNFDECQYTHFIKPYEKYKDRWFKIKPVLHKTLKDGLPYEFMGCEYIDCRARKYADIPIVQEYEAYKTPWIGEHKNVNVWFVLANGYAVGFNENPARGWSFPVVKYKK